MPLRDRAPSGGVVGVDFATFLSWFGDAWQPGQHVALVGPTGCGKTTLSTALAKLRRYVLVLDAKGMDSTLAAAEGLQRSGWPPPRQVMDDIADGKAARLVIGSALRSADDWDRLKATIGAALDGAFESGGWTVFVDELQISAQMMGLSRRIERNLVAARDKGVSMVTAYQAPSWVPTAASRQASWVALWPTRDEDVIKSLAAKVGRSRQELQSALQSLPDFHVLMLGNNPRMPMVCTYPTAIN